MIGILAGLFIISVCVSLLFFFGVIAASSAIFEESILYLFIAIFLFGFGLMFAGLSYECMLEIQKLMG